MRKTMKKEVTKTTVKIARMVVGENGLPEAQKLDDVIMIGNVSVEKAQKQVNKDFNFPVTVFGVEADTEVYEMAVEDFIKHGTLVTGTEEAEEAEEATA